MVNTKRSYSGYSPYSSSVKREKGNLKETRGFDTSTFTVPVNNNFFLGKTVFATVRINKMTSKKLEKLLNKKCYHQKKIILIFILIFNI